MATSSIRQAVTFVFLLAVSLIGPAIAQAQSPDTGRVPVVLILPFDTERTGRAPNPGTSETMAEYLGEALIANGAFRVMDGNWLDVSRPTTTGRADVRAKALAANVDYVIEGTLSQYHIAQERRTLGGLPFIRAIGGITKAESNIEVAVRIIDVATGEIVSTTIGRGNANHTTRGLAVGGVIGGMPGLIGGATSASGIKPKLTDRAIGSALEMAAQGVINAAARLRKQ
jgi:curli biogenesis system outer membrane secretion channel CsgG